MLRSFLDLPASRELTRITRFGGWYLPEGRCRPRLVMHIDGRPYAGLQSRVPRPDVRRYHPDHDDSLLSGFLGDLVLPPSVEPGSEVEVEIRDEGTDGPPVVLHSETYPVVEGGPTAAPRERDFDLADLLLYPVEDGAAPDDDVRVHVRAGCPHFLPPGEMPTVKITQKESAHPYSDAVLAFLEEFGTGVVLDFGAGQTEETFLRRNVCALDVHQFSHTDVASALPRLPFRDEAFDAVFSQATFEHVPDPGAAARELLRVMKPGGMIHVDTAFLQPLHGDPGHYFNMTREALRLVMADFEEVESGVAPHQAPSWGLRLQVDAIRHYLRDEELAGSLARFEEWLQTEGGRLDEALGPRGRETIAAGVFFVGRKPGRASTTRDRAPDAS